jgi:hypothetical protein
MEALGWGWDDDGEPTLRRRHRHHFTPEPPPLPEWNPTDDDRKAGLAAALAACYDAGLTPAEAAVSVGCANRTARTHYRRLAAEKRTEAGIHAG